MSARIQHEWNNLVSFGKTVERLSKTFATFASSHGFPTSPAGDVEFVRAKLGDCRRYASELCPGVKLRGGS
jgi:hypothetical protein